VHSTLPYNNRAIPVAGYWARLDETFYKVVKTTCRAVMVLSCMFVLLGCVCAAQPDNISPSAGSKMG
jgi:hypothetical protein